MLHLHVSSLVELHTVSNNIKDTDNYQTFHKRIMLVQMKITVKKNRQLFAWFLNFLSKNKIFKNKFGEGDAYLTKI